MLQLLTKHAIDLHDVNERIVTEAAGDEPLEKATVLDWDRVQSEILHRVLNDDLRPGLPGQADGLPVFTAQYIAGMWHADCNCRPTFADIASFWKSKTKQILYAVASAANGSDSE